MFNRPKVTSTRPHTHTRSLADMLKAPLFQRQDENGRIRVE